MFALISAIPFSALRRGCIPLLAAMALAGCASERGIPEFQVYQSAFEATEATATAVIDEMEAVEIAVSLELIGQGFSPLEPERDVSGRIRANGGFDDAFHMVDAVYYATGRTPPVATAFRRALRAVGDFNDAVGAYADGRALDAVRAEFVGLGASLEDLAGSAGIGGALGLSVPGGAAAGAAFDVVRGALDAGTKEAFRQAMLDAHPQIDAILAEMRDAAPRIFDLLTRDARNRAKDAITAGRVADRDAAIAEIDRYRVVMSNWVVSLEDARLALAAVIAAIRAPTTAAGLLAELTATVGQAGAVTSQTRRILGEIRAAR